MASIETKIRQQLSKSLGIPVGLVPAELIKQQMQSVGTITLGAPPPPPGFLLPFPAPPTVSRAKKAKTSYSFKVGDWVVQSPEGLTRWGDQSSGGKGQVTNIFSRDTLPIKVKWEKADRNTYEVTELMFPAVKVTSDTVSFESVVLAKEKKEEIKAAISQIDNTELLFSEWGFSDVFEKGTAVTLLFYGIPGGGKTLMAQAIADDLGAELKIYGMAEIGSSEPGGSERFIQKIFQDAKDFFFKQKKHQVVLFDECDALLYDRNKVGVILGAQINTLLTEIERHDGIIIFTTNRIGTLDPALERRIAAKIEFPFPTREQRVAIWKRMIPKKAPIAKDVDFEELAKYPLAGGNIKNAVLNAARMAAYKKQKTITMHNFLTAIEREAQSQKAFESEHGNFYGERVIDYGITEGAKREIKTDSVLNQKGKQL